MEASRNRVVSGCSREQVLRSFASRGINPLHPDTRGEMIKSKRIAVAAMAAVLALAGAACGSDDPVADEPAAEEEAAEEPAAEEEAAEEPAEEAGPFLGLAFDTGGRGDGTFNDMAGQGADNAEANLSIAVQELEATSDQDRQPNLEALAAAGQQARCRSRLRIW